VKDGHRRQLRASLAAFEAAVRDMERVGRDGRSPTSGQPLAPLPAADWEAIAAPLQRAAGRLAEVARRLDPEGAERRSHEESIGATLFRLAILLRQVEEGIVDDLSPARLRRRYGALSAEESADLEALVHNMRGDLVEAREVIEALRAQREGTH